MRIDALCTIGKDREYDLDEKTLLKEMDNCQVEKAIITAVDRYYAVKNDEGITLLKLLQDTLIGFYLLYSS